MPEITNNIISGKLQHEEISLDEQNEERPIRLSLDEPMEEIGAIKAMKETGQTRSEDEANRKVMVFLREKGLSENLIELLNGTGLTDEYIRLLKTLNLNDDDIENVRELWRVKIEGSESSDFTNPTASDSSSSDAYMSQDSLYLKEALGKPLIGALREIVTKKPADPIEYLGHWLLHFKVCEERAMQEKERELELSINREKLRTEKIEDKESFAAERK